MEAKELRIGNYVSTPFGDFIIRQQDLNNDIISESGIKPIPLTEEWLLKFGFVHYRNKYYRLNYSGDRYMLFGLGNWHIEMCLGDITTAQGPCKYVHQLQNLYFALTGEELTLSK